jgi:hypothetical protein
MVAVKLGPTAPGKKMVPRTPGSAVSAAASLLYIFSTRLPRIIDCLTGREWAFLGASTRED